MIMWSEKRERKPREQTRCAPERGAHDVYKIFLLKKENAKPCQCLNPDLSVSECRGLRKTVNGAALKQWAKPRVSFFIEYTARKISSDISKDSSDWKGRGKRAIKHFHSGKSKLTNHRKKKAGKFEHQWIRQHIKELPLNGLGGMILWLYFLNNPYLLKFSA